MALSTRQLVMRILPDNRHCVSVFPKRNFGVRPWIGFSAWRCSSRVVDAGSFAGAARHFGISPEMAGNHVKALEAHLGVRLLNRTTRRMHLTEAGAAYHARCAQILAEIGQAEAEAGSQQAAPRGLLRITGPLTFGELHLGSAISDYMARYPTVSVEAFLSDRHVKSDR